MSPAATLGRPLLRSPDLEAQLRADGYVVVDLLDEYEVAELVVAYDDRSCGTERTEPGAYNDTFAEFSIVHSTPAFRRHAFDRIARSVGRRADEHLDRCRPVVANYVNKLPGKGLVPVHQNMSLADEGSSRSLSVWVALVDCNEVNGTLEVVPGSHLGLRGPRGTWAYQAFSEVADLLRDEYLVAVPVRAGQAIVLDDALIHYSAPNRSERDRLAIQLVVVPDEAPALSFEVVNEVEGSLHIDVLEVDPPYYWDFWDGRGDRAHARHTATITVDRPAVSRDAFLAAWRANRRGRRSPWPG